jgi:short subunit dehydrogenase-like uncharacterized protein
MCESFNSNILSQFFSNHHHSSLFLIVSWLSLEQVIMTEKESPRQFDLIIYGVSCLTGRLLIDYFKQSYPASTGTGGLKWGIADEVRDDLDEVIHKCKLKKEIANSSFVVRSDDLMGLKKVVSQCKVFVNVTNSLMMKGTHLVEACVESETHYLDLSNEPLFVRKCIDLFHRDA